MSDKSIRIGLVGCAGTGKSTLARRVAVELGITFLPSKQITQDILERDGYDYAADIQIERFLAQEGRQMEILRKTGAREKNLDFFVTDRTAVDLAAYAICELYDRDPKALRKIYEQAEGWALEYTHLFICPWQDTPVEGNQKRTLNNWYQFKIHSLELGIIREWGINVHELQSPVLEDRVAEILKVVGAVPAHT